MGLILLRAGIGVLFARELTREAIEAAREAGVARFRPILLTSLTTFAGLLPIIIDNDIQARSLVPMAISLAFGVVFATVITLILVPAGYVIVEDVRRRLTRRAQPMDRQLATPQT